jgi:sRNA-binding protein
MRARLAQAMPAPLPDPPRPAAAPDLAAAKASRERQERRSELYLRLRQLSPALFAGPAAPMAIGIRAEIIRRLELDDDRDLAALRAVLSQAVARPAYQTALAAEGAMRFDLDGNPVELVNDEHRARAQRALEKMKQKGVG